ncbi:MAG TPA: polymorphic toxin-type HINT domain-containing protein, partial [Gemmataceae bacterium]|nr:polymorphic toxin-type HINT domain-containing protein [Gemmataceae bacterium]
GSNALQTRYLRGDIVDQLFARIGSGGAAWYLTDREGSVRNLTDSSGTLQDTIAYDAYGNVTSESNSTAGGAYKYTGLRSDSETGFLATPNRYYNPATGSWVGQDPAGFKAGDPNLYRYVGNSPMDATDPSGLAPGNGLQFMLGQMGSTPTQASVAALASIIAANSPSLASGKGGFMGSGIPAQMKLMALASIVGAMQGQGIEPDLFTKITSGGAGFGDGLTGGGTKYLRKWMGIDAVDYNSGWYTGMNYAGTAYGIGLSFVNPCAVGGMAGMGLRGVSGLQAVGAAGSAGDNFSQGHYVAGSMDALAAIMSASQAGRACFAAGTPLLTPEGDKPIEQFRPGDLILSAPEEDPEAPPQARQVEEVFTNYAALLNLHVGAKVIRTTSAHPFYIKDKGWVKAQELQKGDLLHSHDGQWVPVQAVTDSGEQTPVYNLRVADYHTYFVGEDDWGFSVWAHNACAEPIQNRPAHGDTWHNATGTGRASQLEAQYGQGNVRWNQGLVNAQGVSIPGKRPDIQYIVGGQVHIIELQSPGQSATYMTGMEDLYQSLLGGNFGSYSWIAHP